MDLRKRITAFIVVLSIFSLQITPILAASNQSDLLVLKAREISVKAKDGDVNGTATECTVIENPVHGVKSFLSEETEIFEVLDNQNTDTIFSNEDSMYVQNGMKINVKEVQTSDAIVVTEGIDIHSKQFLSSDFTILYCENGDIELNVTDMVFNGLIYAPKGTVSINAKNVDITGAIIADTIDINANMFNITADEYSNNMQQYLDNFKNDGYIKLAAYFRDEEFFVDFKSNIDVKNATVYGRFEDADTFVEIGQIEGTSGSVGTVEYQDKMDVIVIGTDAFGEQAESNIVSFGRGAEGRVQNADFDTDGDGIEDGIEVFYTKTNPKLQDSDGDGFSDKMESFYLYTDPNVYTEDSDFDNDGLSNVEEIALGTLVYLEDTDFDGKKDGEDTEPLKRNGNAKNLSNTIEVGKFDKVVSGFDKNGNFVQKVYDFINERTKIEVQENVVFTYYYNYDGNISSKVGKVDGDYRVNTYTYDGDKVAFLSNNNYHYGFQYNDNRNIIEITLNDELLIAYDYLDDGSVVTTYGNGYVKSEIKSENQITASDNEGILYTVCGEENAERYEFADSGFVLKYTYDEEGDLTGIESGFDFAVQYEELEGSDKRTVYRIDEKTYTQENIYTETEEGSMSTTNLISGDMISVYQNGENQMIQEHILGGVGYKTVYTYDEQGDLKEIVYPDGNTVAYDYNETGSLCATYENGVLTHEYSYDSINRLIGEVDYKEQVKKTYEYDIYDNILGIQTYNLEDVLVAEDIYSYNTEYGDQLAAYNSIDIAYDASGNPLTYLNGETFKWKGDKLSQANINGKNIQFYYDREGMPVSKVVNGKEIQYLMEGNDFIGEKSEGKTKVYMYDSSCSVVGFIYEGVPYYYVKNASNDVVGIVNQNYEMLCQYQYDTWGNIIEIIGNQELAKENPFRYRSYYYDSDLQMYNLKTRFYDSKIGRFISMDDKEAAIYEQDNLNLYAYCNNSPVEHYDPLGLSTEFIFVFTLPEFKQCSLNIIHDLDVYFGTVYDYYHEGDVIKDKEGQTEESFEDVWNDLPWMDIVIFHTHGGSHSLGTKEGDYNFNPLTILGLEYKSIKVLILLGCNNGHWDYWGQNIANSFAQRITGYVVASDGSVKFDITKNSELWRTAYYESIKTAEFKEDCDDQNRKNYGWLIYKERGIKVEVEKTGIYELSMRVIMNDLIDRGYFRFK